MGLVGEASCKEMEGLDLSQQVCLEAVGPESQKISMPSLPPFAKQCPYVWSGSRMHWKTIVEPVDGAVFTIEHP